MKRRLATFVFFLLANLSGVLWGQTLTGAHDPTVIKDNRCVYSLLSTNNLLQIRQSTDEVNWTSIGNIFQTVPAWVNTALGATIANLWAPCIRYNNGLYWVYYAGSSFGTNNSVIGVVSNPTLDPTAANYKWTDQGLVLQSSSANNYNCIDPDMFVDTNNNVWLVFGSFWSGIKMIAINPATGKQLASNTTIYSLASRGGGAIEGASLIQHGGYYYLFSSWDTCCQGVSSTYNTRMGRATNVTGPYTDEAGTALMSSGGTELLSSYAQYIGPGGGEAFQDGRRNYFAHHYYDANHAGNPYLQAREIVFDNNGWCNITQPYLGRHEAFEAEHAHLANVAVSQTASASNGDYVTGITAAGSQVVFYINALAAGNYEAALRYSNTGTAATQTLTVNGGPSVSVPYPSTGGTLAFSAAQAVTVNITLVEGYNAITFQSGTGAVALDRMDLIRLAGEITAAGSDDHDCSVTYQAANNSAVFSPGGDAQYENLDFKTGGYTNLSVVFSGACTGPLTFTLDSLTGTLAAAAKVTVSGPQTLTLALPASFKSVTGVHDLFAQFTGSGSCALGSFQFTAQLGTSTPTPSPSLTSTATRTGTPTSTPSATWSATPTATSSGTATRTATGTPTPTRTNSPTLTATGTPSMTRTFSPTATASSTTTRTVTSTPSPTVTLTFSATPTSTPTRTVSFTATPSVSSTPTPLNSATATATSSKTSSASPTASRTATETATSSTTATFSITPSATDSMTPTASLTASRTSTSTSTPSLTATQTATSTATLTFTVTFTSTHSFTPTLPATATPIYTETSTPTKTFTPTSTATNTYTFTVTSTATQSPTSSGTATSSLTPSRTPTLTVTFTPSSTASSTTTATRSSTPTFTFTVTASPSATPTPTNTLVDTPTQTASPQGTTGALLYPNPVNGSGPVTLQLTLSGPANKVQIFVFTTAFRRVSEVTLSDVPPGITDMALPLTDSRGIPLANGLYYVLVHTPQGRTIVKLMILR